MFALSIVHFFRLTIENHQIDNPVMPLFEYACRGCGRQFEFLTRQGQAPCCPSCGKEDLEKKLSVFAVSSSSASFEGPPGPGACGTCGDPRGPGACSVNSPRHL
jgi:putative FmdB family regulatory protein